MNSYEEKRQARIDRLRGRADRLANQADATVGQARKMASVIPFGQPIASNSQRGRDIRYRERIDQTFRKGFELLNEAKDADRRADAAERNDAISSDDPDALVKLREKLAGLEGARTRMVDANKALRQGADDAVLAAITGWPIEQVAKLREGDTFGNKGFAPYKLTNIGNEIRRLKKRIEELEAKASRAAPEPETIGQVRIVEEENRVRIFFPDKPSDDMRSRLKRSGFKWSPTVGAWQRNPSPWVWELARGFARELLPKVDAP